MIEKPERPYWEGEKYKQASERITKTGKLSITGDEWDALGGTVPAILTENPGKTRAELMSDDELLAYLKKEQQLINELSADEFKEDTFRQSFRSAEMEDYAATISYLRSIGRLPKGFEAEEKGK